MFSFVPSCYLIDEQVKERSFINTGSRKNRSAFRVLPDYVAAEFMGIASKADVECFSPFAYVFPTIRHVKCFVSSKSTIPSFNKDCWSSWKKFIRFCEKFKYTFEFSYDSCDAFLTSLQAFMHWRLCVTQSPVGNYFVLEGTFEKWAVQIVKAFCVNINRKFNKKFTMKYFWPEKSLYSFTANTFSQLDTYKKKRSKTPAKGCLIRKLWFERLPFMKASVGRLSQEDLVLCICTVLYFSHKRMNILCPLAGLMI